MNEPQIILVIDDSEDDRMLYRRALKQSNEAMYMVVEADNGRDGLNAIEEHQPNCILLDYSMPGHNGVEILKRIRAKHPFIPVLMLTGQGNEKVAVTAMQAGAQNYIAKTTITSETLDHAIHVAIDHCALEKRIHEQRTSLEVFTRALAHDLREPVHTIRLFSEMIIQEETFTTPKTKGYFQHIHNAADRMQMLIETVFIYTRLEDPAQIVKEHCKTDLILEEVKENLSHLMLEHKTLITADSLPEIYANRMQLIQLFQNLISNAIHHSQKPVSIHLHAKEQETEWLFSVQDNGPGIDPIHFQKIFEPFKRLVHHEEGAGLGLAICKKILESHGGKIWCESELGTGTTFLFTLPKREKIPNDIPAAATSVTVASPIPTNKALANILVVDDRESDRDLIRIRLIEKPQLQCNLFVACGAMEALERLQDRNTPIDLMLLDINMPEMDGLELLQRMQKEGSLNKTTVIMCTGSRYDKDMEKAEALGATGYLVKPGEFDVLRTMIENNPNLQLCSNQEGYTLLRTA